MSKITPLNRYYRCNDLRGICCGLRSIKCPPLGFKGETAQCSVTVMANSYNDNVIAVTSDGIILWGKDMGSFHLLPVTTYYQIDLTGGNYRLEEIAKLTQEWLLLEQE